MFISIPKDFFVPVLFTDNFTLNLENNNMEYDMYKENDNPTLDEADEEFIHSQTVAE